MSDKRERVDRYEQAARDIVEACEARFNYGEEVNPVAVMDDVAEMVSRVKARIAQALRDEGKRTDEAKAEVYRLQGAHADIARGVKDALGLKNWPNMKKGETFREGVARLVRERLHAEWKRGRDAAWAHVKPYLGGTVGPMVEDEIRALRADDDESGA